MVNTPRSLDGNDPKRTEKGEGIYYVCAFCRSRFSLPLTVPVSIRYLGRTPAVECPACSDGQETGETSRRAVPG